MMMEKNMNVMVLVVWLLWKST